MARADIDNNAVATGTYGGAPVTSNTSASSVPVDGTPLLLVEKTAVVNTGSDGRPDAGDTVSYTITVRNTGSLTLQNVVTSDPLLTLSAATLSDDVAPLGDSTSGAAAGNILAPGDALSYTGTYTLTVADIAAGQISNTATATATTTTGTPVNGSGTLVTPLTAQPGLSLDKTAVADFGSDGIANAGDTIAYQFLVTNTGNVALTNVRIDDPLLMAAAAEAAGMDRVLALLEDASLQTDPIATASVGQALAMSRHPHMPLSSPPPKQLHVAQPHEPAFIGPRILPPEMRAAIHGTRKLVNLTGAADTAGLGDLVGIYVELVNTGDVPLTNIMVQQDGAEAFGNLLEYLAPNESNKANVIFTREVTEADLAAGELLLPATITANTRGRTITIGLSDSLPLTGLAARDALVTASIDPANIPTLGPGENFTFTSTYVITQADVDAGHVVNNATAIGVDPSNQDVTATDSTDTPLPPVPSIALVKSGTLDLGADAVASVGDLITYQFSVTNTGNVTLDDITVTDPLVTVAGGPLSGLLPGATDSTTFTATYALTQADIDAGQVQNQATASGTPPGGGTPVTDLSDESDETGNDPTITPIDGVPKITLLKQVASVEDINNNGLTDAGDEIRYRFVVANTGNVTLENVAVVDQNANVSVTPAAPTGVTLAPGTTDSTTFTGTYVLQQVDVDAGFFENTADVTGDVPGSGTGAQATDQSHPDDPDADGPTRHDIPAEPGIALLKREVSVTDTNGNGINDISDIINYAFTVTNTGNVTLTNITLTDANASLVGGPIASLAPGATDTTTFNATHEITAADMVAGSVVNSATAQGNTSSGGNVTDVSDPDDITEDDPTITAVVVNPAIAVVKTAQSVATNDQGTPLNPLDDTLEITYAFTVTNTGNVTLTNIQITDPLVTVTGSLATLDPAESDSTTFQAVYTVTPADITAGQVVNQATVSGLDPSNTPVTDLSDDTSTLENDPTITPLANQPGIALVKTFDSFIDVNSNSVTDAGDGIRYTLAVTNTGNVALSNVTVSDPAAVVSGGPLLSLPVGGVDTTTFSAIHTLTQPEIDAGTFQNQATASASSTAGPVTDLSDESSTTGDDPTVVPLTVPPPQIALVKTVSSITDANGNGATDQGDTINYAFTVYNTGVVTLFNVTLTDVNAVVSGGPIVSLGPGSNDATTFTGSHVVTASDIVAGQVTNQATAQGASAFGIVVADESDNANVTGDNPTVTPVAAPGVVLSKTAARSEIRRGERVTYTITASNLGAGPYDLADLMPAGFSYVAGSATINDVAATPAISGNTLSFANLTPVAGKITLKLSLLASATLSNGEFTNRARLFLNATGVLLAEASAKVTIKEEHVFDCGEIIGKVFDDLNCNGYADAGEPGIPAVRVATVKGLLITTDKHGRYHLSCADVPNAAIGSNFLMKLDTRTLPQGYGLTTENPRDVRLTRGKLTKLNFGACRKRDLNLDITRDAFAGNGLELKDKWNAGIDRLVRLMQQGGSDLTITYRCTSHAPIADRRVAHVKQLIRTRWIEKGGTSPLNIETRVECGR